MSDYLIFVIFVFILFMGIFIFSLDIYLILFSWDGLGIVSFLLIIYYQNYISYNSGLIVLLLNRFGDIILFLSVLFIFDLGFWDLTFFEDS
jgi:NADH-ubiquinone oxidoreductase chain 5